MKSMILLATAVLVLCGCSAHAARDPIPAASATAAPTASSNMSTDLDGTHWKFVEVAGTAVPADVTATLRFKDGRASGKAGCNAYGASYQIKPDGSAHFQQGLSTRMACLTPPGAMQVERDVFQALQHAERVERNGDSLSLLDAAGKPLATLVRSDTP